ncbi:hypothetical protein HYS50_00850 [Candidatus Woesearchaeota archaeon]|nr:hypothetical protein [Candidatus Woesearchaeota archaeon]
MQCAVDTNILFTFFWKESFLNLILKEQHITCYAPEYALEEIKKYAPDIQKRAYLSKEEWKTLLQSLAGQVLFIPLENYISSFSVVVGASQHCSSEQEREAFLKDTDFLALGVELKCPLWSHDRLLKKQPLITVLNTRDLIALFPDDKA